MNNKEIKEILEKAEKSPLWILEGRINRQNVKLLNLKGQGVMSQDNRWRNLIAKRNLYRKIMLKKLKLWIKGKCDDGNPTYADYLHSSSYNKQGEEKLGEEVLK